MSFLAGAGFAVFILILFAGIYLSLFGLPGTVVIFLDVLVYSLATDFNHVGWKALLALLIFAIIAETVDFLLENTHIREARVRRSPLWAALAGSIIGMCILTPFLWGAGIWLGFFLGGVAGILLAEIFRQLKLKSPYQSSGRIFLTMIGKKAAKGSFSVIMIFVALSNIYS